MVLIDHPQQQDVPQDGSSVTRGAAARAARRPGGRAGRAALAPASPVAGPGRRRRARRPRRPAARAAPADRRRGGQRRRGAADGPARRRRHDLLPLLRRADRVDHAGQRARRRSATSSPSPRPSSAGWPPTASRTSRSTPTASPRPAWPTRRPACGIDWSLLAGIGRVESNHGRFRGAVLNSDGTSSPRIMGPPLNGVQFAFIRDTDGGPFDGDSTYDRAVGPMQFIPATWRAYGVDADGTGSADPFNINDAALGAAQLPLRRRRQPAHRRRAAQRRHGLQPLRQLRERGPRPRPRLRHRHPGRRHPAGRQHHRRRPGTGRLRHSGGATAAVRPRPRPRPSVAPATRRRRPDRPTGREPLRWSAPQGSGAPADNGGGRRRRRSRGGTRRRRRWRRRSAAPSRRQSGGVGLGRFGPALRAAAPPAPGPGTGIPARRCPPRRAAAASGAGRRPRCRLPRSAGSRSAARWSPG